MSETRSPKFEVRNKLEAKIRKTDCAFGNSTGARAIPARSAFTHMPGAVNERYFLFELWNSDFFRISDFELPSELFNLFPQRPQISVFERHLFDFFFALFSSDNDRALEPDARRVELVHLAGIAGQIV